MLFSTQPFVLRSCSGPSTWKTPGISESGATWTYSSRNFASACCSVAVVAQVAAELSGYKEIADK